MRLYSAIFRDLRVIFVLQFAFAVDQSAGLCHTKQCCLLIGPRILYSHSRTLCQRPTKSLSPTMKRSPASSQQSKSSKAAESSPVHQEDAAMMEQLEGVCMSRGRLPPGESRDVNIDGVCMTTPGAVDLLDAATLKLSYGNKLGLLSSSSMQHVGAEELCCSSP